MQIRYCYPGRNISMTLVIQNFTIPIVSLVLAENRSGSGKKTTLYTGFILVNGGIMIQAAN